MTSLPSGCLGCGTPVAWPWRRCPPCYRRHAGLPEPAPAPVAAAPPLTRQAPAWTACNACGHLNGRHATTCTAPKGDTA